MGQINDKRNTSGIEFHPPRLIGMTPSLAAEVLLNVSLVLLSVFGTGWSVISSFSLPLMPLTVFLYTLLFSAVFAVTFHLKRLRYFVLPLLACFYAVGIYYLRKELVQGLFITANQIFSAWSKKSDYVFPTLKISVPTEQFSYPCTVFLLCGAFLLSGLLCYAIVRKKSFWLTFFISFPCLMLAFAFMITPAYPAVLMLGACWFTLFFMSTAARKKDYSKRKAVLHANSTAATRTGLLILPIAAICFILIFYLFPANNYVRSPRAESLRSEITGTLFDSDSLFKTGSMLRDISDHVSLKGAGSVRYFDKTMLQVWTSNSNTGYLKDFTGSLYTGLSWEELPDDDYQKISSKLQGISVHNMLYLYLMFFQGGDATSLNQFEIRVKNVAASRQRIYAPYNLNTGPEDIKGVRFIKDSSIRSGYLFGTSEYNLYAYDMTDVQMNSSPASVFINMVADPSFFYQPSRYNLTPRAVRNYLSQQRRFDTLNAGNLGDFYTSTLSPELLDMLTEDKRRFVQAEQDYRLFMYEPYTRLPEGIKEKMQALLKQEGLLHDYSSVGDMAAAVQAYLKEGFTYNLTPGRVPEGKDFTEYFLLENKKGFCVHFATAAAVMLRAMGVPARYADGYIVTPGDYEEAIDGWAQIKDNHAHAWVEIYYPGLGWQPIEVTPGVNIVENQTPNNTPEETEPQETPETAPAEPTEETNPVQYSWGTDDTRNALKLFLYVLCAISVWMAALAVRHRIVLAGRAKSFSQKDTNMAMIALYGYLLKMAKYGGEIGADMTALAQKARFSQHRITPEELKDCRDFAASFAGQNYASLKKWKRFIFKYVDHFI